MAGEADEYLPLTPIVGAAGAGNGNLPQTGAGGAGNDDLPQTGAGGAGNDDLPQTGAGGEGNDDLPQTGAAGAGNGNLPQTGAAGADPSQIVAKALLCFNDKYIQIYSSCEESYRLTASGNLNVPYGYVDHYCQGPCLTETHLVLDCLEGIFSHFEFYNRATIKDVKETIKEGCGHGPNRGEFNVAEHIQAGENLAPKTSKGALPGLLLMIVACHILL
ncbi:hypothetical protein RJ640_014722 [Escallonia rubra]|uniref:DUF7731 domain-containing protein n=1 Tax=Escallonia rubra TaxID=112253 RepID=A0AA88UM15_9ASTE|nr:hypothetical protein RJ640_014722 [Escallonia rubra]